MEKENELPNLVAFEKVIRKIRKFAREQNVEITEVAVEGVIQPFIVSGVRICGIFSPNE